MSTHKDRPDAWEKTTLGELCRIEIGGTPSRNVAKYWAEGRQGFPWVSIADLKGRVVRSTSERITLAGVRGSNTKPVPAGTPLMSFKLTLGRAAIAGMDLFTNEAIAAFYAANDQVVAEWLYHVLPSVARGGTAEQAIKGQTLNMAKLRQLAIAVPPFSEQRRIAEVLDTADEAIRQTEGLIAKLKQTKQGLLHDLLTRGLDENGELRDPVVHPEQFKDSPLGRIPREWNVVSVGDLLTGRPQNGFSPKEADAPTGTLMLGLGCLTPDGFVPRHLKYAPLEDTRVRSTLLHDGDVLVSRSNTRDLVGLVGVYRDIGHPCIYPDLMMRLTPGPSISGEFLALLLMHYSVRRQLTSAASGTSGSMVKISGSVVMGALALSVPQREQSRIMDRLEHQQARIRAEQAYRDKLVLLKKGLMQDLLTGRVRVPVPETEPEPIEVGA
jgi:type I restriction enzyme, S subunit